MFNILSNGVRNQQNDQALKPFPRQSQRLPALLSINHAIGNHPMQGVTEHLTGFLEAHSVLTLVDEVLCLVPLEPEFLSLCYCNCIYITTQ